MTTMASAVAQLAHDLLEDGARVALDGDVGGAAAAELAGVDIDLDDLRLLEAPAEAEAEVHDRADEEDDIGLLEGGPAAAGEELRMVPGEGAAPHVVQVDGRLGHLDEVAELLAGVLPVDGGAGHDQRPLRLRDDLRGLLDDLRVGVDAALRAVALREVDVVLLHLAEEHIRGDLQEGRPLASGQSGPES